MSETISEMILPGTYIEVRAEGLIGITGIGTGNVGVVGTASRGPLNTVQILGNLSDAIDTFGAYDRWPDTAAARPNALTLVRALEQVFAGGASTVYAVRIAAQGGTPMASATWALKSAADDTLVTLTATSPGTWANDVDVTLDAPAGQPVTLTLVFGRQKETYTADDAGGLAAAVNDGSRLVSASTPTAANAGTAPKTVTAGTTPGGPNGVPVSTTEIAAGLAALAAQPVNIVVAAGADAKDAAATLLAHLEQTENDGRERIAVVGASSDVPATVLSDDVSAGSSPRLVLVAPGIVATDAARVGERTNVVRLPAAYAAALVAGKIATLAPHVSLTNQVLPAAGLTAEYSRGEQKLLLTNQVAVLHRELGIRVVKGITTDTGAFRQITVRRIVDYAKAGVRIGASSYIGKLNNVRVRAALKATLDGFLSGMVLDEMIIGYKLDVSATRAQEINGQAIVTLVLQPTFSIDFVKVIMNLQ